MLTLFKIEQTQRIVYNFGEKNMKAAYRNSLRSKDMIRTALITLLEKKQDINDITISDITKTANINRGTFYNHYNNLIEVLEEIKTELFELLASEIKISAKINDLQGFIKILIEHFKTNEKFYKIIVKSIPRELIDEMKIEFVKLIRQLELGIDETKMYFIVNGLAGICIDYLLGKINLNLDDLGKKAYEIITAIINK